jgi:hypothetical protein
MDKYIPSSPLGNVANKQLGLHPNILQFVEEDISFVNTSFLILAVTP